MQCANVVKAVRALIEASGFYEYYDPRDGQGPGAPDFSCPAALALEDWIG